MTKENKIIKDLKERNEKLVNQYRDRDIRCVSLERQLEKLQQENLELRIQVSTREDVANKYKAVIDKAVDIAWKYGQIDGDHHQKWVTDQMVRALLGSAYENFVKDYEEDGDYEWDIGIAP